MAYPIYPSVDGEFNFPPEVRDALAKSTENKSAIETNPVVVGNKNKNTTQDGRLDSIESKNSTQDGRLTTIESKNAAQDILIDNIFKKTIAVDAPVDFDANSVDAQAIHMVNSSDGALNIPAAGSWVLVTYPNSSDGVALQQLAYKYSMGGLELWSRVKTSGGWATWSRLGSEQDFRLNVEEAATREANSTAPISTPSGFKIRDSSGYTAFAVNDNGDTQLGEVRQEHRQIAGAGAYRIRDKAGSVALAVDEDGTTTVGTTRIEPNNDPSAPFRIRDKAGAVAFSVYSDGTVGLSESLNVTDVHLIIGAGQSNMSGRGTPSGAEFDPVDSRLYQFGSGASEITPANVPLDMHDTPTGLSPLTTFAREYAKTVPATTAILLVPAAHGGTGFTTATPLTWDSTIAGGLYDDMITQTNNAVVAAQDLWGATPTISAFLWHQGEADGSLTTSEYSAHFDALVTGVRNDLGEPMLPVIVGQMSSDWVAQNAGPLRVQAAHIDTPARMPLTAFAESLPNTGREGDLVHFGRAGVEYLGTTMFKALTVARANQEVFLVMPPTELQCSKAAGVIVAKWSAPLCRALGYLVEYRVGAGAWTEITDRPIASLRSQILPNDATEVRVATVGVTSSSRFTYPVPVQGV